VQNAAKSSEKKISKLIEAFVLQSWK
jgi:hypothetical protein